MAIKVLCPCGRYRLFPDAQEGKTSVCRKCGAAITVAGEKIAAPSVRKLRYVLLPAILVLLIPVAVAIQVWRSWQHRFTSAAEEYKDGSKAPIDPAIDEPRIERLLNALAAAARENNQHAFVGCFHLRRMLAEIEIRGG